MTDRRATGAERVRRRARAGAAKAADWGRRLGVLPHQPERWSPEAWTDAYGSGQLDYYGTLDELARYSLLVGYVRFFFPPVPGTTPPRVLDVGCGTGLLRARLDGLPLSEYVGVDLSPTAVEEASRRDLARSRFLVGEITELDLGAFDVIVLNEMLYYVADPVSFLQRVGELLEPAGLLLISMWRHPGDRSLWRTVDEQFPLVDRVEARNRGNAVNPRGWVVACHRRRPVAPEASNGG